MRTNLTTLADKIDHSFTDHSLLEMALKHPSLDIGVEDNQRLEFLGDAVLDLVIAEYLYQHFPSEEEGRLDRRRASLVSGKALAPKALELGLNTVLVVSEAQRTHHPEPSKGMLEDALEALIGAIYLDAGLDAARRSIRHIFAPELAAMAEGSPHDSRAKNRLQEWTQKHRQGAQPKYALIGSEGPDHARVYHVSVSLDDEELGTGSGSSKKAAESAAAEDALLGLNVG
ncbi:ribonuclease III [Coraliomargarita akajimensis]|uniref:Ribonuclease 3 n=1 Tax=Coraliomargarita akajimensis (strain DSM 45221 / IAM 15411 / JCM 23193 / KCTC 12865 / 04OKA010-24) TaxID=583355 RepID=D5EQA1_CORAD|nr:ribonuclease III [Coraliomargarita akajimensis]ADE53869.1 ribonuclease III [Coraliomargarita akajimensis DSM 45221]